MGRYSKDKGTRFQIKICRKLTKWITGKERPEIFWNTAGSGAKATVAEKKKEETKMHGDVMAIDKEGQWLTDSFFIELKHYKKIECISNFLDKRGLVYRWWEDLDNKATEAGKCPILIYKRNNQVEVIFFAYQYSFASYYPECFDKIFKKSYFMKINNYYEQEYGSILVFMLSDFFRYIDAENMKFNYCKVL